MGGFHLRPHKKAKVASGARPTSWFAPVLPDWLDSSSHSRSHFHSHSTPSPTHPTPSRSFTLSSSPSSDLESLAQTTTSDPNTQKSRVRRLSRTFSQSILRRCASTLSTTSPSIKEEDSTEELKEEKTTPGTHPTGTPRTKKTGRRNVSTPRPMTTMSVYSTSPAPSLPPGAAAPTVGHVLDLDFNDSELFSRPSIHFGTDEHGRSAVRCMSMSLDAYASMSLPASKTNYRPSSVFTMSRPMAEGAPAIPPRSHLRGTASSSSTSYTKRSSSLSVPSGSGRSSPSRPFVLEVEPPSANFGETMVFSKPKPADEIINFRPGPQRQLSYERPSAVPKRSSYGHHDPHKVRDHRPPKKSSSGVYTPSTFPGPGGSPSLLSSTSPNASKSDAPKQSSTASYPRPSGLIYTPRAPSSHFTAGAAVPISVPSAVRSAPHSPRSSSLLHGLHTSHGSHSSLASNASSQQSRASYSPPSSAHSAKSVSPPATPTTPVSLRGERGVIAIAGESDDDLPRPLLDEPTPKPSPRPTHQALSPTPDNSTPIAERTVTMSPSAPKRARRKPVPRLDDDLVKRLEAIEV